MASLKVGGMVVPQASTSTTSTAPAASNNESCSSSSHVHGTAGGGGSSGGGGGGCACCSQTVPLQQSLEEVAFEKGLWGYILRGASAAQVEEMIAQKANERKLPRETVVDEKDKSGYTPLLYAARAGETEVCEVLLRYGADVAALTPGLKHSALHRAALHGHSSTISLLLRAGADVTAKDATGRTAQDTAAEKGHIEVVALLRAAAAKQ